MLAGVIAVLSLETNKIEFNHWFEVEARKRKQSDEYEVQDIDEWETGTPETEDKNDYHIFKRSLIMIK